MAPSPVPDDMHPVVPRVPISVGAMIFDQAARLLILKPTYKRGWTIPGGQMEADGETPWEACRREVHEECGIEVTSGTLVCVDFLRPRTKRPGGVRLLFNCGAVDDATIAGVAVQAEEISTYRFADLPVALGLLSGPVRRRVTSALGPSPNFYLEEGHPVATVR